MSNDTLDKFLKWRAGRTTKVVRPAPLSESARSNPESARSNPESARPRAPKPVGTVVGNQEDIIRALKRGIGLRQIARDRGLNYHHLTKAVKCWGTFCWLTHDEIRNLNLNPAQLAGNRAATDRVRDGGPAVGDDGSPDTTSLQ